MMKIIIQVVDKLYNTVLKQLVIITTIMDNTTAEQEFIIAIKAFLSIDEWWAR
jgi:hypothetical protein